MQLLISEAIIAIQRGGIVAFPTETVYGLGASIFCPSAIEQIFKIKGRPSDNPLIAHISNLEMVEKIAIDVPPLFYSLAERFFPGPLTLVLPKHPDVPLTASAGLETIGVRMPAHPLALELIEGVGVPVVAPSANLSGRPSSTTADHVLHDFGDSLAGVIDGGPCSIGLESTVLALTPRPYLLRPGAISKETLEAHLGHPLDWVSTENRPASPGMKYRHYAPDAKVILVDEPVRCTHKQRYIEALKAEELYAILRKADLDGIEELFILCDEPILQNVALMNRLRKAALIG